MAEFSQTLDTRLVYKIGITSFIRITISEIFSDVIVVDAFILSTGNALRCNVNVCVTKRILEGFVLSVTLFLF